LIFKIISLARNSEKNAIKVSLTIPPHPKSVATLPCDAQVAPAVATCNKLKHAIYSSSVSGMNYVDNDEAGEGHVIKTLTVAI